MPWKFRSPRLWKSNDLAILISVWLARIQEAKEIWSLNSRNSDETAELWPKIKIWRDSLSLHQADMEKLDYPYLESLLSDEDREEYKSMRGNDALEFLITNPLLDPVQARNLRVRFLLMKAVEEGRIDSSDISLHDSLFKALGEIMMKEDRTSEEEHQATELREKLDMIWKKADPNNLSHRLAMMYAKRPPKPC